MKAFVTGGTGFIGRSLIRQLIARGYRVAALARSQEGAAVLRALGATVVPGDVTDRESMRAAMRGSDVVFHLAAIYDYAPEAQACLLYTSPSPRDRTRSRMPSSA